MFQKQVSAIRLAVANASRINDLVVAEKAFTKIIKEKLRTPHRVTKVPAFFFLKNDEVGSVYYKRSYVYEKLGKLAIKKKNYELALDYLERSIEDTKNAIKFYEDVSKKDACRKEIAEDEALIKNIEQNLSFSVTPELSSVSEEDSIEEEVIIASPKRKRTPSKKYDSPKSDESLYSEKKVYSTRAHRMWSPKKEYEDLVERLDAEQRDSKRSKTAQNC